MALLTLSNVSVRRDGRYLLWDTSLAIEPAQITGVFGRSGSGKTTLGRVVAGLEQPTGGTVESSALRVSLASDRPAFAPELTVVENLAMFAALEGIAARKRSREIAFVLELLRLNDCRGRFPRSLSAGELRRLELARALLPDCDVLVIDSLLDSLDSTLFEQVWDSLLSLRRTQSRTIVALTASERVASACPCIAVLHRGQVKFAGRPEDFRRMAGEDLLVLGKVEDAAVRSRLQEKLAVVVREDDGFLSLQVANADRVAADLLEEYGDRLGCVYLKRPTLDDAVEMLDGGPAAAAMAAEREVK